MRITNETKQKILSMRQSGLTLESIGKTLGVSTSIVLYHSSNKQKEKAIARAIKNRKPQTDEQKEKTKKYNKKYHSERYKNDSEFRDRVRTKNRENWRKKYGKSNNLS